MITRTLQSNTKQTFLHRVAMIVLVAPFLLAPQYIFPENLEPGSHLSKLQLQFDIAFDNIDKPVTDLNASYSKALERLFKSESGAGRIDSALQVKKEIEEFGDGDEFNLETFSKRITKNAVLEKVQRKYLSERDRLHNLNLDSRNQLLNNYRDILKKYELEQTKLGKAEVAVTARKVREALNKDPRFADGVHLSSSMKPFTGTFHFVCKGDIELQLNGERVSFRNKADERKKYIDGNSRPKMIRVGDILRIRMRSKTVFRSLIMTIESDDDTIAVPIKLEHYRYLGTEAEGNEMELEKINQLTKRPESGSADVNMDAMWKDKKLSKPSYNDSEWIKIGASADWYTYFIILKKDMLLPAK